MEGVSCGTVFDEPGYEPFRRPGFAASRGVLARWTASRSGSRMRRSHALCHSQTAPHVEQVSRVEPPESASASIGDAS